MCVKQYHECGLVCARMHVKLQQNTVVSGQPKDVWVNLPRISKNKIPVLKMVMDLYAEERHVLGILSILALAASKLILRQHLCSDLPCGSFCIQFQAGLSSLLPPVSGQCCFFPGSTATKSHSSCTISISSPLQGALPPNHVSAAQSILLHSRERCHQIT